MPSDRVPLLWRPIWMLLALGLLATACVGSTPTASPAPTPEREIAPLLEPTPTPSDSVSDVPADTEADPDVFEPVPADPPATAAPTTLSLACLTRRPQYAQTQLALGTQGELAGVVDLAAAGDLGGVGLLGSPDAGLSAVLAQLQLSSFVPILVASDEEGGSVQRLATLLGPLPSAATSAATQTVEQVQEQFRTYGERLRELGVHVVFGPVVDVGSGPGIASRSFGDDPAVVAAYAAAVAAGLEQAGLMPVFKHFPGHGRASADSHLGISVTPSIDELRATDLVPYVELVGDHVNDDAAVMVGHLSVPGLSGDLPTSLSPQAINGLLREDIGFDGIVFSDALNMRAIVDTYGPLDAIERSLRAGVDIVILGSLADVTPALDHLEARALEDPGLAALLDQRVRRVLAAKGEASICAGAQ